MTQYYGPPQLMFTAPIVDLYKQKVWSKFDLWYFIMISVFRASRTLTSILITRMLRLKTWLFISSYLIQLASSHVSLTFPPARKYNLDYLDSLSSPPPCGMPKGNIKTSFISGSTFNATWHLGYAHQGSHRLELLSENGTQLYMLASELVSSDPTATSQLIRLPANFTCADCIIRLMRQSAELRNPYYWFWSCGDVDIVQAHQYKETCSGNGFAFNGACTCNPGFFGSRCEYEDECVNDSGCGGPTSGECIHLGGTNLPRRQCFCKNGWIGKKCSRRNQENGIPIPTPATLTKELLEAQFNKNLLDPRVHLYWRILSAGVKQVEFVLYVNGTSYAALGWRPADFQGDCTRYPNDKPPPSPKRRKRQAPPLNATLDAVPLGEEPFEYPLHPMSCNDVVIGAARGRSYRILDYWAGDISTPREDSLWDGTDDILAGIGWESKGVTTLIFRKKMDGADIPDRWNDWHLTRPSHVIWARGQEHGEYVHSLPSGLDPSASATNKPTVPLFYTQDEIKYHGFRGQRGSTVIDFLAKNKTGP